MLTITGLSKTYSNGVKALDHVDLTVKSGMFGLLGPNGAGKSTLMRTVASLQEPDEGKIMLDDLDISQNPQDLRRQLGYLPQEFGVYPRISAFDLLEHLAVLKGILNKAERREQIDALLNQTNLFNEQKRAVNTFSGGMKQRFGIAQALLGNPRLIIVDEPTAGLDPEERNRFHNLLSSIGEHVVVLLSTHIVEDVRDLCPQMAIMASGRIVAKGIPGELVKELDGRIWYKTVDPATVADYRTELSVITTRLFAGQTRLHVLSEENPGRGFEALKPDLKDVYFSTLFSLGKN